MITVFIETLQTIVFHIQFIFTLFCRRKYERWKKQQPSDIVSQKDF